MRDLDRLDRPLRVAVLAARQRRDRDVLRRLLGDPPDGLEVAGRGGREAGLDDVDLEAGQLAGDLELLGGGQAGARRLLPVAQGRVEDADRAGRHERAARPGYWRAHRAAPGVVAAAWAWPAWTSTGLRNGIWARNRAPTCSIWWSRSAARSRSNSWRPVSFSSIQRSANEPSWMSLEDGLHPLADALVDEPRPADVVAVLGGVADAEAHEVEAAAIHQVDDELELVHRLEVGELGLVAGLDERLERHLHQRRGAAAQDGLLAEEVGLGLLLERRLEDARAGVARSRGHRPASGRGRCRTGRARRRTGPARRRRPGTRSGPGGPGPSARPSRRRRSPGGSIRPNRRLKPWANIRQLPGAQVRRDLGVVHGLLRRVRHEDHDDVGGLDRVGDVGDPQAGLLGDGPGSSTPAPARR